MPGSGGVENWAAMALSCACSSGSASVLRPGVLVIATCSSASTSPVSGSKVNTGER
ncbi:hypothetical protein D9M69_660190 [compost metagenome]